MNYIEVVLDEVKRNTPEKGYNVCTFDDFGRPGEMLTLIAHADTKEEAEKIKQKLEGDTVYIYKASKKQDQIRKKQTEIGQKNHNINIYLKMAEDDFNKGENRSNEKYESKNYRLRKKEL